MTTIPTVALHRETKFYTIASVNILSEILSFIVVLALYNFDYGVVILFIRILLFSIIRFFLLYILSKNTLLKLAKLNFDFRHLSEVMRLP